MYTREYSALSGAQRVYIMRIFWVKGIGCIKEASRTLARGARACYLFIHWAVRDSSYPLKQRPLARLPEEITKLDSEVLCVELEMRLRELNFAAPVGIIHRAVRSCKLLEKRHA